MRSLAHARLTVLALTAVPLALAATCDESKLRAPPRDDQDRAAIARGHDAIERFGCGTCHEIPGIRAAHGLVGPSLDRIASRTYVAGVLANRPENLVRWVEDPPGVDPLTAMPKLGVTEAEARDIASFLYTLE